MPPSTSTPVPPPPAPPSPAPPSLFPADPQGAAAYAGCQIFPAGDYYNRVVTSAPVDPKSAAYIQATVDAGDTGGFNMWTPTAEYINLANSATPRVRTASKSGHVIPSPFPWAPGFQIQTVSDAHAFVLDTSSCTLYEAYNASYANGVLSAYSGEEFDLSKPMMQGETFGSVTAAGIPMFPGLIRPEEIQAGVIKHALYWGGVYGTLSQTAYVAPATNNDAVPYQGPAGETPLPLGSRLRLRASFPVSGLAPQAQIVARAMQTYGIILADTGCCDAVESILPANPSSDPFNAGDLATLNSIHITDFAVVDSP
ncbi:MAG: hypothetical protein KGM44_11455 [bacterium]|nr:hypothetical protein [bacterium]